MEGVSHIIEILDTPSTHIFMHRRHDLKLKIIIFTAIKCIRSLATFLLPFLPFFIYNTHTHINTTVHNKYYVRPAFHNLRHRIRYFFLWLWTYRLKFFLFLYYYLNRWYSVCCGIIKIRHNSPIIIDDALLTRKIRLG